MGPVVDDQSASPGHGLVEILQHVQQTGILLPVPQDPGLVVQELVVLGQGFRVPGPQLADGVVQEGPPFRRAGLDEGQILRTEEDRLEDPRQLPGGL